MIGIWMGGRRLRHRCLGRAAVLVCHLRGILLWLLVVSWVLLWVWLLHVGRRWGSILWLLGLWAPIYSWMMRHGLVHHLGLHRYLVCVMLRIRIHLWWGL